MSHQIITVKINGFRSVVLVKDLMPVFYPNLYVTSELSANAFNTQKKYLEHIGLFEDFLAYEKIDLINRLEQRPEPYYLNDNEISCFARDAGFHKAVLDKKYAGARPLYPAHETVDASHAIQRLESVRDYLNFLYYKLIDNSAQDKAAEYLVRCFNRKIADITPAINKTKINEIKGLTDRERNRLLEVIHPDSNENPFANNSLKLRNYIIVLLGLEMGLRRSEMLLIKISDIHWHSGELAVVNLEDSRIDTRTIAPQFKTHERQLVMSEDLIWALREYVENLRVRENMPSEARTHPFLLVSHRRNEGRALSIKAADSILPRVGAAIPELKRIHLHILRHDCVYTLLESMREDLELLRPEARARKVQKILTFAFGWSVYSDMPGLYGAKFCKEEADRAFIKRAEKFKAIREGIETEIIKGGLNDYQN